MKVSKGSFTLLGIVFVSAVVGSFFVDLDDDQKVAGCVFTAIINFVLVRPALWRLHHDLCTWKRKK
jgi:hypothetical protein